MVSLLAPTPCSPLPQEKFHPLFGGIGVLRLAYRATPAGGRFRASERLLQQYRNSRTLLPKKVLLGEAGLIASMIASYDSKQVVAARVCCEGGEVK